MARAAARAARLLLLCAAAAVAEEADAFSPVEYANLLAGSFTKGDVFSTGNTMPLVGRPWGFNHWALQTNDGQSSWWFNGNDHEFRWIRCTHQPSPWIGDYGWFFVGPQMGGFTTKPTGFFEPRSGRIKPHAMDFRTAPDGMRVELAPTMHGAALRVTFPGASRAEKRVCFKLGGGGGDSYKSAGGGAAEFRTNRNSGGAPNFNHHVFVEAVSGSPSFESHGHDTFCFGYPSSATTVEVRMCSSFISQEQARHTYDVELRRESSHERSFGDVRLESEDEWNALLSRAAVKNTHADVSPPTSALEGKDLVVFYTGLYRALTFPRRIDEPSARGAEKRLHWSPYSKGGSVHDGTLVTDNGFWDTFRTVYPLLALVYPDHLGWIVDGWVNAYREGGWIPKWASPGYRNSMVGTYGDVVVAEAIVKGVGGFDEAAAWDALHKDAYEEAPQGGAVGKVGLRVYNQHGYIPADSGVSDCVSRTLDFAHADWATANAAEVLGHAEDAKRLRDRARGAVTHLYDKSTGLMRPKQKSGAFSSRFSPTRWGDGYTEGSAWHHSFPPFDVELLASLHGGKDGLVKQIQDMLDAPSTFEAGGYGQTIHEMREMRALAMGQYGHNNQPSHHILWLLHLCGRADLGNKYVRRVIDDAYMVDAYSGDEDNGEMGSWFVLAALGLFSVSPGSEDYVLGGPLFDRVTISGIPGRPALDIYAHRPDRSVTDVAEIWLATAGDHNEVKVDAPSIRYSALKKGGQLHFYMKGTSKASAALHWTTANNAGRDAAPAHGAVETLVEDAVSKLAATRDEFWQSVVGDRDRDHANSANASPTEVPREAEAPPRPLEPPAFPFAEKPPIAAAVAPAAPPRRPAAPAKLTRDDPPPPPPLPLGFLAGVAFAAFCAGRCSKRRDGGRGKRQAHIV